MSPQALRASQAKLFVQECREGEAWFLKTANDSPEFKLTKMGELASRVVAGLVGDARVKGGLVSDADAAEAGSALLAILASPEFSEHGAFAVSTAGGIKVASAVLRDHRVNAKIALHALKLMVRPMRGWTQSEAGPHEEAGLTVSVLPDELPPVPHAVISEPRQNAAGLPGSRWNNH